MEEKVNRASAPRADNDGVYHLQLKPGDVPGYIILPGAPERTLKIAEDWEEAEEVAFNREFRTVRGKYKGMEIACTSTGIGGPSSEICLHELNVVGCIPASAWVPRAASFPNSTWVILSFLLHVSGRTALLHPMLSLNTPAYADIYVVMALMEACERLGFRYGLGLCYTVGSFYIGQGRPLNEDKSGFWPSFAENIIPDLAAAKVTNIEMEAAAQFVVGKLHGMRMGAVLAVVSNRVLDRWGDAGGEEKACLAASEAMRILKEWDDSGRVTINIRMGKG